MVFFEGLRWSSSKRKWSSSKGIGVKKEGVTRLFRLGFSDTRGSLQSAGFCPRSSSFADCLVVKIRSRLLTKLIAVLGVLSIRLLFKTCRLKVVLESEGINPYGSTGDRRYLYCVWHDQLVMAVFSDRTVSMAGLVSAHQDGSYLADAMKLVGIVPVRGSSKRGGSQAMRQLLERVRKLHVAITPDGPRGPRRKVKSGIVYLASRSGRAIIPCAYDCRRSWRIRGNWTDMLFPMPFTTIYARGGLPFAVPDGIGREELAVYVERLEAEMTRLARLVGPSAVAAAPVMHRDAA
jgi:hypothetical protein